MYGPKAAHEDPDQMISAGNLSGMRVPSSMLQRSSRKRVMTCCMTMIRWEA
jgi:hypothetical protein